MDHVHPEAASLLAQLLAGQEGALGSDLVGSYLFGSAVTGDFEPGVSDIDTLAVLPADLTVTQLESLRRLHEEIVEDMPAWNDRVEAVYLSSTALADFRTRPFPAARISPGEPFHAIEIDDRWLIDWYQVRRVGVPLTGPPSTAVVPPISKDEWLAAMRRHLLEWPEDDAELGSPRSGAYAILSMCRGLRACRTGDHVSKREGARWAEGLLPQHADLIRRALSSRSTSRSRPTTGSSFALTDVRRFLADVKGMLEQPA